MSLEIALFMITAVVLPLALTEFGDWSPWLAKRIVVWAAHRLGNHAVAERYEEEWLAQLPDIPGKLAQLFTAVGHVIYLPRTRRALRENEQTDSPCGHVSFEHVGLTQTGHDAEFDLQYLIAAAQDGDIEAFGHIYDHYTDDVHRYVYFRIGDRELAENLTSETFLCALRRINSTWCGCDFDAWLLAIARSLVSEHFKSGRYRLEAPFGEMLEVDHDEHALEAMMRDRFKVLLLALRELDTDHQECITLRFLQGLSITKTALVMNKSEEAVKTLQRCAVRRLTRALPEGFP